MRNHLGPTRPLPRRHAAASRACGAGLAGCGLGLALLLAGCAQTVENLAQEQAAAPPAATAPQSEEDLKTQCWMAQETKKDVNDIDAKIAAVDQCIAEGRKHLPPAG